MEYFLPIKKNRRKPLMKWQFLFAAFILFSNALWAQNRTITGIVISGVDQAPLPGVSVLVKDTNLGTTTDEQGRFTLSVPENAVLVISYIGFLPENIDVGRQTHLSVVLQSDTKSMDEVVVVGYGSIKRGDLTSATAHVGPKDFRQSGARNAMDLLQGKVAGLQITRSGSNPNSGVSVQLRGATSIQGGNSPLIVVDGIPGGNMDLLQQEDIESIDVLKDGSAAAIYGTQANGGVILVTTKKGKPGQTRFDYANYFRKEFVQRQPAFLSADEYRTKMEEGVFSGTDGGANVNAFDELINKGNISQYHTLAISGGGENNSFRASTYYRNLEGIAKENGRQEYGIRANFNGKGLNDRLNTTINLVTNYNNANLLGGGGWEWAYTRNPTQPLKNADGSWYYEQTTTNEVARLYEEKNRRQQQTSSLDGKVSYMFLEGLNGSVFGSVQRDSYTDSYYASLNSEPSFKNGNGYQGEANQTSFLRTDYAFEPTIDYKTIIDDDHSITAVAGYSYRRSVEQGFDARNFGFSSDVLEDNKLQTGNALIDGKAEMNSNKWDSKLIAFFGRANYSYKGKYMFQGIYRREGSSRFGANNKWGNFGSVSAGWNISSEDFMRDVAFVDDLKLRAGYGITGNQDIDNYLSLVTLGTGNFYIFPEGADGIWRQTYGPNRNPNPNLKWETKKEFNIGVDFSLFNGKLGGSIDAYKRITDDLLGEYKSQQPPFIRDFLMTNVGQLSSKGIELTLTASVVQTDKVTWRTDFTASTNSARMDSFSNDIYKVSYRDFGAIGGAGALGDAFRVMEGGKLGNFYGKRFAGFTEDGKWLFYNKDGAAVPFDQINDSRTDLENTDLAVIGNAIPKFYASWNNTVTYKNLDLRVFFRGRFGYDVLNTTELSYGNDVALPNNVLASAFTKHADLNDTYMYSDYYLENGSFVKLDEVTLGYTFKLNTTRLRNFRIYVTGQNLATFTSYSGNDPDFILDNGFGNEINGRRLGLDPRSPYPSTRSFLVGLNIGF